MGGLSSKLLLLHSNRTVTFKNKAELKNTGLPAGCSILSAENESFYDKRAAEPSDFGDLREHALTGRGTRSRRCLLRTPHLIKASLFCFGFALLLEKRVLPSAVEINE